MQHWLRLKALKARLIELYGEDPDSRFVQHALDVDRRAKLS
jgi:hypothetical protein